MANVQGVIERRLTDAELRARRQRQDRYVRQFLTKLEAAYKATQGSTLRFA